ncbi:MAG TPA: hypothetical protein PLJ54_00660 [Rhodoglobus sp.]|nr:hypothetical protein [Rhodoglobus sp.]
MIDQNGALLPNGLPQARARLGVGQGIAIAVGLVISVAASAGVGWVAFNQQRVVDQAAVWQYAPDAAIASYAQRTDLTDEGSFLFFASRPQVSTGQLFNDICSAHQEDVGILGCYVPTTRQIHLYDVTDPRLDGLEEVVAAHELLHAAWDRMSAAERNALAPLLEAEAAEHADDADFAATLEFYQRTEPGERLNELHSIIGTEFTGLDDALEAHYARYFADRSAVTALHEQSNRVFLEQAAAVRGLTAQIDALAASIDSDYSAYNSAYDQLNSDIDAFNARASAGDFSSQDQFDRARGELVERQDELDAQYAAIEANVNQYNSLVAQLDALNATTEELNAAINIAPHPTAESAG